MELNKAFGTPTRIYSDLIAGSAGGVIGGVVNGVPAPAAPRLDANQAVADLSRGIPLSAQSQDLGDLFEYKLKDHVTIRKNQSALVPILQTRIDAEKVSVWNPSESSVPARALDEQHQHAHLRRRQLQRARRRRLCRRRPDGSRSSRAKSVCSPTPPTSVVLVDARLQGDTSESPRVIIAARRHDADDAGARRKVRTHAQPRHRLANRGD